MEQMLTNKPIAGPGRFKNSHLAQAWLVLVLALVFGIGLAVVQVKLNPIIAANKINETLEKIPSLVTGAGGTPQDLEIIPGTIGFEKNGEAAFYRLFRVVSRDALIGWVVKTEGRGYGDRIELLLGLNPETTAITGIFILDQKETPGLGAKIASLGWRKQFAGKMTDRPLVLAKDGATAPNGIDVITGATISSRSVITMVNRAVKDLAGKLTPKAVRFTEPGEKP